MKKLITIILLIGFSFASVALPPDMQADRYLVQVEKALKGKDKDYKTAAEAMDKIMALKDKHNLKLPIEFYFKYAKVLLGARTKANEAFAAINHYLAATGKTGANYVEALDLYDRATFWQLVQAQTANEIKQLIKSGANLNGKNKYGATPLHYAAQYNNNPNIITALVQAGANVNAENEKGSTPLIYAAYHNNNPNIIKALVQAGAGANVNAKNEDGYTPLMLLNKYNEEMSDEDKAIVESWLKNPSLLR